MLTVNGQSSPPVGTILDVCRKLDVHVPSFCHDDRLSRGAHCRACLVEVEGQMVSACTTAAKSGMHILTDTERLRVYRRDLGELMTAECSPGGAVSRELESWGVDGLRYRKSHRALRSDQSHPYLRLNMNQCILCRKCVRACEEIQGQFVYAVADRGDQTHLTWGAGSFVDSDCVSCGACASVCPTGAISDIDCGRVDGEERRVGTTCAYCGVGCQLWVHGNDSRVLRIEGAESPVNRAHLCLKGRYAHSFAIHQDRLTRPLAREGGRLVPVSWEKALGLIAEAFRRANGPIAGLSSSRCTNEENYLFQKWFRAGLFTNDVDCCARVCHAPSAAGMRQAFGTGAATNSFSDIEKADLFLVVGANVTEAHPVIGARVKQAVLRGTRLLVIDPRRTELARLADVHLQLRPGTNVPLLNSLACVLIDERLVNLEFVRARVEGFDELAAFIKSATPEVTAEITQVPPELIRSAARFYGTAKQPMMLHGLGVTEHYQGSEAVMLLCNLAMLQGAVGRPGVGVNPLRGQNNVQGAADMGCQPDFLTGYSPVSNAQERERFAEVWARPIPAMPGRTLPRMLEAARAGEIQAMFILGEDIVQTDPDSGRTRAALEALPFLVVQELFLSETAEYADVVLPGASFLEKDGTFTNAERRIQRVCQVIQPPGEARADWEILCELMAATGYPQRYGHPSDVMQEIARVAPVFAGVSYSRLEREGLQWPVPSEGHPGTPILHTESFPRGRGKLARVEYVPSPELSGALTLITGRVLEHYNAGSMTRRTPNVILKPADFLEIHPRDAEVREIVNGDKVRIRSAHGQAKAVACVTDRVTPGVVFLSFHFPETCTNDVTGTVRDRLTDCPEYKVTAVEIDRIPVDLQD